MDMLIQLARLPSLESAVQHLASSDACVRRAMAYERDKVLVWVQEVFGSTWSSECAVAFGRQPIGCYIAVQSHSICGFCCLESTFRNFIGPIGVAKRARNTGIGRALVLSALYEMRHAGYAYAIVGDVGEPQFFQQVANAVEIRGSSTGAYPVKLA